MVGGWFEKLYNDREKGKLVFLDKKPCENDSVFSI